MIDKYIPNPRPLFDSTILETKEHRGRLLMGGKSNGIVFDTTRKGIKINGYYSGLDEEAKYANLRKPVFIPWKEFDKMKQRALSPGKKEKRKPDFIDETPNDKYLKTLPIVHINDKKYYIDSVCKERRSVDNPKNVYKF